MNWMNKRRQQYVKVYKQTNPLRYPLDELGYMLASGKCDTLMRLRKRAANSKKSYDVGLG